MGSAPLYGHNAAWAKQQSVVPYGFPRKNSLQDISNVVNQPLCFVPAQTGIRYGLAVELGSDGSASRLQVTLHHGALNKGGDIRRMTPGIQNFFQDTGLLSIGLIGIGMVGVDEGRRVIQSPLFVQFMKKPQIFKMVIGLMLPPLIDKTPKYGMEEGIAEIQSKRSDPA